MLLKEKCKQAIASWEKTKIDFLKIKEVIDSTKVFRFNETDCIWIKEYNENSKFHIYAGVHDKEFILIIVPLDKEGKEVDLDMYLTKPLTGLEQEITLNETEVVTTVSKTKLSKDLEITKFWKEVDLPVSNEPTITERTSGKDIEKWRYECLNWFYYEHSTSKGRNIFRTFTVPFADLTRKDGGQGEIVAFFGLKQSPIYQKLIPLLIFVATSDNTTGEILRAKRNQNITLTNTDDWSRPCPPLCKDKTNFSLL
ncbi:hypothetical protein EI427_19455 [Flammeovirga pectinis]|uniref:Uncharacterized protein n=1 Tax=Flammeovirga pectinis TaxID=2494373 RepID=A0A3S9P7W0_9BACT|nr:hypothetical protein [Flammeovirga pectinis]AZQ64308.1 hypothetical protein EI427_19455 [Flammeovirga pectinis]